MRPLFDDNAEDPSAVTRDYVFELNDADGAAPMLSVFGGKITTFRKLAEQVLQRLKPYFPNMPRAWTADAALPGGDIAAADFGSFAAGLRRDYPALPADAVDHYARLYGTRAYQLLDGARMPDDLGPSLWRRALSARSRVPAGPGMGIDRRTTFCERRTKHGLRLAAEQRQAFSDWMFKMAKSA